MHAFCGVRYQFRSMFSILKTQMRLRKHEPIANLPVAKINLNGLNILRGFHQISQINSYTANCSHCTMRKLLLIGIFLSKTFLKALDKFLHDIGTVPQWLPREDIISFYGRWINTLKPEQNSSHYTEGIFKYIFFVFHILIPFSQKFYPKHPKQWCCNTLTDIFVTQPDELKAWHIWFYKNMRLLQQKVSDFAAYVSLLWLYFLYCYTCISIFFHEWLICKYQLNISDYVFFQKLSVFV